MRIKYGIFLVWIIFNVGQIKAQHYPFTIITLKDGLPQSSVFKTVQDKQGYIWMATESGICRYDGYEFKNYSYHSGLDANYISDLEFDEDGRLWASSFGSGLAVFDGQKFISFNSNTGFPVDYVKDFVITKEREIWMATQNYGITRLQWGVHPKIITYKNIFDKYRPNQIIQRRNGDVITAGVTGLVVFEKKNNYKARLIPLPMPTVAIYEDEELGLWVGGRTLYYMKGDSITDHSSWLHEGAIVQNFNTTQKANTIYISTMNGLIIVEKGKISRLSTENGLSYHLIRNVFEDSFGNTWVSSWGNGATILNNQGIMHFDSDGKGGDMCSFFIVEDGENKKWIGKYSDGLYIWNDSILTQASLDLPPGTNANMAAKSDNGDFYCVANGNMIAKVSHDKIAWKWYCPIQDAGLYSILPLNNNKHIISSDVGAFYLNEQTGKTDSIDGLPAIFFRSAFFDEWKNIWFIGDRGEVFRFKDGVIRDYTTLANPEFVGINHSLYDPFHHLWWFATDKGLLCWNGQKRFLLHSGNVLKSDLMFSITQDSTGRIWAGHVHGVECIDVDKMKITYFGYDQGFLPIETNAGAAYTDRDGNVWFGTLTSVTKFDMSLLEKDSTTGVLRVEEIYVNEKLHYKEEYDDTLYPKLSLKYNQNNIGFKIVSLCYTNGSDVQYSWKLEGFDDNWTTRTNSRDLNYTNLKPGDYTFKAKAINPNGFVTNQVEIHIHIAKPFWNTAGFYLFEIIIFLFIVFLSFRFTRQSSNNRLGQIMTLLSIFIVFESGMLYISSYTDKFTNGIPVFQLVMNVLLAASLHPLEQRIQLFMKKWARKK